MKNNHFDGSVRPSSFTADPAGRRAAQDLAQSRARSCPARGWGCCGGVAATPSVGQSRLCVPRESGGGFSRDNGKTNPRALPKLEIHGFKYHIVQEECLRRAGSVVGLIPSSCLQAQSRNPAPHQYPLPVYWCRCHAQGQSTLGVPRGTGGYPEQVQAPQLSPRR